MSSRSFSVVVVGALLAACTDHPSGPAIRRPTLNVQATCAAPDSIRQFLHIADGSTYGAKQSLANEAVLPLNGGNGFRREYFGQAMCNDGSELSPTGINFNFGQPSGTEHQVELLEHVRRTYATNLAYEYTGRVLRGLYPHSETRVWVYPGPSSGIRQYARVRVQAPFSGSWFDAAISLRQGETATLPAAVFFDAWGDTLAGASAGDLQVVSYPTGVVEPGPNRTIVANQCGTTDVHMRATVTIPHNARTASATTPAKRVTVTDCVGRIEIVPSPIPVTAGSKSTIETRVFSTAGTRLADRDALVQLAVSDSSRLTIGAGWNGPRTLQASEAGTYQLTASLSGVTATAAVNAAPELTAIVAGPNAVKPSVACTWSATVSGGYPPYTYFWVRESSGWTPGANLGGGQSLTYAHSQPGSSFTLKLKVTDAIGASKYVWQGTISVSKYYSTDCATL